jgi:hypothetical protein
MRKYIRFVMLSFAAVVLSSFPVLAEDAALPAWDLYLGYSTQMMTLSKARVKELIAQTTNSTGVPFDQFNKELLQTVCTPKLTLNTIDLDASKIKREARSSDLLDAAIGQLLNYIAFDKKKSLLNAVLLVNATGDKISSLDGYSYWRLLINAYSQLENDDIDGFRKSIYRLWVEEVVPLKREQYLGYDSDHAFSYQLTHVCNSILNLVINRAILSEGKRGLYLLGGAVQGVYNSKDKTDEQYKSVMEHYLGAESDSANIVFSTYFTEALVNEKYSIYGSKNKSQLESLTDAVKYFNSAQTNSSTAKGKLAVLKAEARMFTTVVAKLYNREIAQDRGAIRDFIYRNIKPTVDACIKEYNDIAKPAGSKRQTYIPKSGFDNPNEYIAALKDIWKGAAELVRFQSNLVKREGFKTDFLKKNNAKMIDFATGYFSVKGYEDLVPDSAFFEASYNADLLANLALDVARVHNTDINIKDAVALQAYSLLLNPYGVYNLYQFSENYFIKPIGTTSTLMMFMEPIGTDIKESVKLCFNDDRYAKDQESIRFLGDEMPVLIRALPQVVGSFEASGVDNITRRFIITAGVYDGMFQIAKKMQAGNPRIIAKNELNIFADKKGSEHPRATIGEFTSETIRQKVLQLLSSSKVLKPADYSALYDELGNSSTDGKHAFLKRLYAEQSKMCSDSDFASIKSLRESVRKYCASAI